MKWPWVSREQFDAAQRAHDARMADRLAELTYWQELHAAADRRYDALLEKFTALRVQGAVPELPPVQYRALDMAQVGAKASDELRDLIHERFAGNTRQLGKALAQLARDRADAVSEDTIRDSILNGYSPEGVPA